MSKHTITLSTLLLPSLFFCLIFFLPPILQLSPLLLVSLPSSFILLPDLYIILSNWYSLPDEFSLKLAVITWLYWWKLPYQWCMDLHISPLISLLVFLWTPNPLYSTWSYLPSFVIGWFGLQVCKRMIIYFLFLLLY